MILLQLNPLSPGVAISEIVILLLIAALIGYLIGRWITKGQLSRLHEVLATKEGELDDCRASQQVPASVHGVKSLSGNTGAIVRDDLKKIEGIGPKIEKLLNGGNIFSFSQLATASPERLLEILRDGGPRFQMHDPQTWPEQAALARDGRWEELEVLQEKLTGGRDVS